MSESEYQFFVGVDWGSETHVVCVLDPDRQLIAERSVPHTGIGLTALADELTALAPAEPGRIAVAIEMPRGAVVDTVLERGMHVFSLNPKQLDRFRDRHTVAGAKDDRRDAFVLADSLRTDRPAFRRVQPDHPRVVELRELSRVEDDLGEELRRLSNRLREQLHRVFPQALTLCAAADEPWFWALVERAPTPVHAQRLSVKTVAAVLKVYRVRRFTVESIREVLQTPAVHVAPGTVEAASAHIALLLPRLRLLEDQRTAVARRIEVLLEELGQEAVPGEHRDVTILRSWRANGARARSTVSGRHPSPLTSFLGGLAPTRLTERGRRPNGRADAVDVKAAVAIGAPSAPSSSQCRYGNTASGSARWSPHGSSPSLRITRLSPRIASRQVSKSGVEKGNWVSLMSDAIAPREVEAGLLRALPVRGERFVRNTYLVVPPGAPAVAADQRPADRVPRPPRSPPATDPLTSRPAYDRPRRSAL